jgi:hypothetical protein
VFFPRNAGSFKSNTTPATPCQAIKNFCAPWMARLKREEKRLYPCPRPPQFESERKIHPPVDKPAFFSSLAKLTTLNEAGLLGVVTLLVGGEDSHEEVDAKANLRCRHFEV